MANEMQMDFELWLKSKFDGDALKAAQAEFRRTQKVAEDAGQGMSNMGSGAAAGLKMMLGELLAITAIISELKEGFTEVTAQEQAFNRLSDAASRFGGNAGELNTQFEKLAKTIQEKSGLDDDALYLAMVKVYQATGDMNEAMGQAALAADVARGANIPLEESLKIVGDAALGKTEAMNRLGLSVALTGQKAKDAENGLNTLRDAFGGAAAKAKGTTVELDKLKEEWGNVRNDFISGSGEMLAGLLKFINLGLQPFFISLELAGNSIRTIINAVKEFGGVIGSIIAGDWQGAREGLAKTKDTLVDGFEKAFDVIKERARKMWATINGDAGGGVDAPEAKGTGKNRRSIGDKDAPDGYDPVIAQENFRQEQLRKLREKMEDDRLKSEADHLKAIDKLRLMSMRADQQRQSEMDRDREEAMRRTTEAIVAEVRLKRAAAEAEKQMRMEVANAALGLMGQVFGESKELAIAGAIINTYEGATKALAQGGIYGPILAAIVIASGIAQVAKIASTDPSQGSGFDDPGNDAAARIGGRRWAMDMIGEFSGGASEISKGWAQGMGGGSTTNDNRRTFNVHLHGAGLIDPSNVQMAKQFKRTLDVIDTQIEGQRAVSRRARS